MLYKFGNYIYHRLNLQASFHSVSKQLLFPCQTMFFPNRFLWCFSITPHEVLCLEILHAYRPMIGPSVLWSGTPCSLVESNEESPRHHSYVGRSEQVWDISRGIRKGKLKAIYKHVKVTYICYMPVHHLIHFYPEDGGRRWLRNVCNNYASDAVFSDSTHV